MQQPPFFSVWKNSRNIVKLSANVIFATDRKFLMIQEWRT